MIQRLCQVKVAKWSSSTLNVAPTHWMRKAGEDVFAVGGGEGGGVGSKELRFIKLTSLGGSPRGIHADCNVFPLAGLKIGAGALHGVALRLDIYGSVATIAV
mmetsp:Transcript_23190/g.43016  ORF Transcript_23190/g.43016 Transcript_23190/m.43016 type:complete len:102 (-) Transcript_23190:1097-1402(-)